MVSNSLPTFIAAVLSVSVANQVSPSSLNVKRNNDNGKPTLPEVSTWNNRTAADWVHEAAKDYASALKLLTPQLNTDSLQYAALELGLEKMQSFPRSELNLIAELKAMISLLGECLRIFAKAKPKNEEAVSHFGMALFYLIMATEKTEYAPDDTRKLAATLLQSMKEKDTEAAVQVAKSMYNGIRKGADK